MTELEKALSGKPFDRRAEDVRAFQSNVKDLCFEFNQTKSFLAFCTFSIVAIKKIHFVLTHEVRTAKLR